VADLWLFQARQIQKIDQMIRRKPWLWQGLPQDWLLVLVFLAPFHVLPVLVLMIDKLSHQQEMLKPRHRRNLGCLNRQTGRDPFLAPP